MLSRLGSHGYPWDVCFTTRFKTWLRLSLPAALVNWLFVRKLNAWFDQEVYGLQRDSSLWKDPLANDYLPACIIRGSVVIKPTAVEFTETTVTFEDGTREDIDVIIFATGISIDFPFLDESVIKISDSKVFLYKNVFPPEMEKPTLAFIGLVQPIASILVVNEMQARWIPRVLKGLNKLPPLEKRMEDIEKKSKMITQRYGTIQGNVFQMDFIEYLDEIASEIGVKPNLFGLLLSDPRLALEVFFGACTSPQFRLSGPRKWDGARKAILSKWDRIVTPMRTRVVRRNKSRDFTLYTLPGLLCLLALMASFFMLTHAVNNLS